ncbi:MAG: hypothetical protein V4585_04275 [Bacteroidota bacterium]|jgi:hypothetical protein
MTRSQLLFAFFLAFTIFSCSKDQSQDPAVTKSEAIKSTEWVVDGFTTADNTPIDPALFSGDAKFINQLTYIFDNTGTVRSYDKISKQAQAYGTWGLTESDTKLDINIQGFKGTFGVIELSKQKMILRNNIKYNNVDVPVNMVFIPLK